MEESEMAVNEREILEGILKKTMNELTPNQMEAASGGTMTSSEISFMKTALAAGKAAGVTKETVLAVLPQYFNYYHEAHPNVTLSEVQAWINSNWNSL